MLKALLNRSRAYLESFYEGIDLSAWQEAIDLCVKTKGTLFFTGIGKSGFIAKKIAMTLVSCGTKAFFLDPLNLLHGDLGVVDKGDVVFMISKSGFTKELLDLVPFLKQRGAQLIACVSSPHSPLQDAAELNIYLPVVAELDEHNLVPTTSTQVQLIFGDVLTMALMRSKGTSLELYASLHPAGSIGKKLLTKVEELMLSNHHVPFCSPDSCVKDILVELTSKKCGCVVIIDENRQPQGIFTDGDLRRSLQSKGVESLEKPVSELMSAKPILIDKNSTALEAKKMMQQEAQGWINALPVVEDNQVIGLLRLHDILKAGI